MSELWNARTCKVYCMAWDAYESSALGYEAAEEVFAREREAGVISTLEYAYLIDLFWDTARI